ncbi:MAG: ExeM/NucH family extracellular endonuclease [Gaiellaceae bacterium]
MGVSRWIALGISALVLVVGAGQAQSAPSELFFSEYVEGTSNNKALEIYNGTGAAIDLAANAYSVQMFFNGSGTAGLTIDLTGSVANDDVFVLAQASANATILAQADQTNAAGWFNGDDAVVLRHNEDVIDVIGQVGFDPGAEWGTGRTSTADNTLRRKPTTSSGDTNGADVFDPAAEWNGFATDNTADLGTRSLATSPTLSVGVVPATAAPGDAITIGAIVTPGTNPASTGLDVTCDLTWAGLNASSPLFDDGTNGDVTAGDNNFTRQLTVPAATAPGTKTGSCGVSDGENRTGDATYSVTIVPAGTDAAPTLATHTPGTGEANVPVDSNIGVTFSEPVNVGGSWYSISCTTSGAHSAGVTGTTDSYVLDPTGDFANGETCTVTINGSLVSDQDASDPPDTVEGNPSWSFGTAAAGALVINEVDYDQPSTDTAEYLELRNNGGTAVQLSGYSVQLINGNAGGALLYNTINLPALSLAAGDYFVICANNANTPNCDLDVTTNTDLIQNGAPDAIGLRNGAGTLVDRLSYEGSTTDFTEGSGVGLVDDGSSATAGISRCPDGADTDQNNVDFKPATNTPGAANSCAADAAPFVTTRTPANAAIGVAINSNITIGFSEAVGVTGSWYTISCSSSGSHDAAVSGGPTTFTLDPTTDFVSGDHCTVTVVAANVTDQDTNDPPNAMEANDVFSLDVAGTFTCGETATPIDVIQGSGAASDRVGQVVTIEGVVVGDYQLTPSEFNGFYVQEEPAGADTNPATSEGIFVFGGGVDVNRGNVVRVRGTVAEFAGLTELSPVSAVLVCPGSPTVPATHVSLPVPAVSDLERYESMLVDFDQTLTVTEVFNLGRFGEVSLSGAGRLFTPTAVAAPGAPAQAVAAQNDRSRIILDDGNNQQNIDPTRYPQGGLTASNTLRVGDSLAGLTGVMDFRFSNYRIQPVGPISFDHTNPRTPAPAPVGGNLKVASFNVLNFFNGNGTGGGFPTSRGANTPEELARQRAKEVSALKAMNADVVGLMEIENDAPPGSAIEDLVAGLNDAMGAGTYSFINTGVIGTDEIKVALIYKPATVSPVGAYKVMTSAVDPRFVDTLNRPSLAQTFQQKASGGKLTVVVNHLKSKGSACSGDPDTGDEQGNCNQTRSKAATALVDWLKTDPTGSGDPDFLLIGDMNSYTFEDPITALTSGGLTNLIRERDGLTAYSYVFDGESGYLDHALATPSLAAQVTGVDHWHINPDEPTVLDYNVEFKTANQVDSFYDPGPYRSSDHDPVVIGLQFTNAPPTANAGGPYSVDEGVSTTVSATGSDPDGDTLAYAWDLDNDGVFETAGQTAAFSAATIDGPATRTIKVQVSDGKSATVATTTVTIVNVPPTATFNAPTSVFAGFPIPLSLTSPHDAAPADTFTYAFDCGTGFGGFGAAASVSCATTDVGIVTVGGRIRDDNEGVTEFPARVNVIVTLTSLCDLVKAYTNDGQVISQLCQRLDQAATADSPTARAAHLATFKDRAEKSGVFTPAQLATLLRLADRLL